MDGELIPIILLPWSALKLNPLTRFSRVSLRRTLTVRAEKTLSEGTLTGRWPKLKAVETA